MVFSTISTNSQHLKRMPPILSLGSSRPSVNLRILLLHPLHYILPCQIMPFPCRRTTTPLPHPPHHQGPVKKHSLNRCSVCCEASALSRHVISRETSTNAQDGGRQSSLSVAMATSAVHLITYDSTCRRSMQTKIVIVQNVKTNFNKHFIFVTECPNLKN